MTDSYYVRTASGGLVPLSAVVSKVRRNRPGSLTEYQQLNSAVIGALPSPGVSLGDGVDWFNEQARPLLPAGDTTISVSPGSS